MKLLLLAPLLIAQINAGPTPETYAKQLRVNRYGIQQGMGEYPGQPTFPIARYLRLAEHLQNLPERERVLWLRMAARSTQLDEPAVFLARMLIESTEEESLRPIRAYIGSHRAGKPNRDFVNSPLEIFRGVPFCVASSAGGTGSPEDAATYVEYLLKNGIWRDVEFKSLPTARIIDIANGYLDSLKIEGLTISQAFRADILYQASIPLKPTGLIEQNHGLPVRSRQED